LVALAILPNLFIRDILLPLFDFIELFPFFYEFFLCIFDDFIDDLIDLEVCDFLPRVLRLKIVPLSSSPSSSSSSSSPYSISIKKSEASNKLDMIF
jgi:hypothetical protein